MSETGKSPVDIDHLTVPELTSLISAAQARRTEIMTGAREALLEEMRNKAAELGLSLKALIGEQPRRSSYAEPRYTRRTAGGRAAAKYRDPETGKTWSGRGREPLWIKGKPRQDFAING